MSAILKSIQVEASPTDRESPGALSSPTEPLLAVLWSIAERLVDEDIGRRDKRAESDTVDPITTA